MLVDDFRICDEAFHRVGRERRVVYRIVQDRLFESDFDRVVAETKRLGEGAPAVGGVRHRHR